MQPGTNEAPPAKKVKSKKKKKKTSSKTSDNPSPHGSRKKKKRKSRKKKVSQVSPTHQMTSTSNNDTTIDGNNSSPVVKISNNITDNNSEPIFLKRGNTVEKLGQSSKVEDSQAAATSNTTSNSTSSNKKNKTRKNDEELRPLKEKNKDEPHPDDMELIENGKDPGIVAMLRVRRKIHFANLIKGPVHNGRLSRWTIGAYAPPSLTTMPLTVLISVYVIQFYEKVGAALGLLACFQAIARAFDVITDPSMSYITDSHRSKYGRRRPFLVTGAPFYGVALFCLLCPWPSLTELGVSVWFGLFYILFFLSATYCNVPYDALAPELTDNEQDRANVFFACTMFDGVGGLAVACLPLGFGSAVLWYRGDKGAEYLSCNTPVDGRIDASSSVGQWFTGVTSAPPTIAKWFGFMTQAASQYGWSRENCVSEKIASQVATVNTTATLNTSTALADLSTWCECLEKSDVVHGLDSARYSYGLVGFAFGMWAIVSLLVCAWFVKERSMMAGAKVLEPAKPLVPSLLNTMQNRPFRVLLPAWTFDSLGTAIIGSLLTFFIRYVVQPEYSNKDLYQCSPRGGTTMNWQCRSDYVLGYSFLAFLFGALLFTPVWLLLAKKFGKRKIWLFWSLVNGVTYLAFAVVGEGDVNLCIAMAMVNGAPAGAKFLADAIAADVIDYDEFLTGQRAEATYTMFKGFLPKIAAIPASALPIALLGSVGHVVMEDGIIMKQPNSVRTFIKIVIIWIPFVLSMLSWYCKLKFPFRTKRQNDMITEGIARHMMNKESLDPCAFVQYLPEKFNVEELKTVNEIDYWPGVKVAQRLVDHYPTGAKAILFTAKVQMVAAITWLVVFTVLSFATTDMLKGDAQYVPVLSIVGLGIGVTLLCFTILRYQAAKRIVAAPSNGAVLDKLLRQREKIEEVQKFSTAVNLIPDCIAKRRKNKIAALHK